MILTTRSDPAMAFWPALDERISVALGVPFTTQHRHAVSGGCINSAYRLQGANQDWFIKLNEADRLAMFEAEAEGLLEIGDSQTLRAPRPLCWGCLENRSYLVLEYVPMRAGSAATMERLGRQLALLHRPTKPYFGWRLDNTIGSTPQRNDASQDWTLFWRQRRLGFQLALAARNGYGGPLQDKGARLLSSLDAFFTHYAPQPSLLHGDLWSGNAAADRHGRPLVFDPAVYYGDREADIAMTELFGGFSKRFYDAYRETWPLDEGYRTRRSLYNLYHVLNHLNLFGRGYLDQAARLLDELLAELG